jgi:hypothetical protein
VVDDAIRFVSDRSKGKENLKQSSAYANDESEQDKEVSKEPEDESKLEEEQEEDAGKIASSSTTTNRIF